MMIKDLFLFYGEKSHCFVAYFYFIFQQIKHWSIMFGVAIRYINI
jgi:hypothetical protein